MFELPKAHFDRLLPLFDTDQSNSTMIFSTLTGHTLGKAYVDDIDQPANALLVTPFQNFSFTHPTVDPHWLNETVTELRQTQGIILNWSPQMAIEPPSSPSREIAGYEFLDFSAAEPIPIPEGRHLQRIDGELFTRRQWRDLVLAAFGSVEDFLRDGIGVALMEGDEICSEAYALFLGAGKFEIGIVTHEKYRKQGCAAIATQHLAHLCEERGYPPHWSYFEGNMASAATARKIGFRNQRTYQWFLYRQAEG